MSVTASAFTYRSPGDWEEVEQVYSFSLVAGNQSLGSFDTKNRSHRENTVSSFHSSRVRVLSIVEPDQHERILARKQVLSNHVRSNAHCTDTYLVQHIYRSAHCTPVCISVSGSWGPSSYQCIGTRTLLCNWLRCRRSVHTLEWYNLHPSIRLHKNMYLVLRIRRHFHIPGHIGELRIFRQSPAYTLEHMCMSKGPCKFPA